MKYTFWFECTDNGGGHQAFEVKAENMLYVLGMLSGIIALCEILELFV